MHPTSLATQRNKSDGLSHFAANKFSTLELKRDHGTQSNLSHRSTIRQVKRVACMGRELWKGSGVVNDPFERERVHTSSNRAVAGGH